MRARGFLPLLLVVVFAVISTSDADAATNIFLKLKTSERAAAEEIPALGFRIPGSLSPRDSSTGVPSGKRQHQPLVIVKSVDKSSPLLRSRQTKGTLPSVEILFLGEVNQDGRQDAHTIRLTDASILDLRPGQEPATEEVVFGYSKLEIDGQDATGENVLTRAFVVPHILERSASVPK